MTGNPFPPKAAPLNCSAHLTPVAAGAIEWGFAAFNEAEHLCVMLPDHPVTITARDSLGRTTTVHFGNYATGDKKAPPTFIDIQHKGAARQPGDRADLPAFEVIGFAPPSAGGDPFDTRDMANSPSLISIMCDGSENATKSKATRTRVYLDADEIDSLYEALQARPEAGGESSLARKLRAAGERLATRREVQA